MRVGSGVAGLALVAGDKAGHPDLASRGIVERPRVLYHAALRRFIMWLHIDDEKVLIATALIQSVACCVGSVIIGVPDLASDEARGVSVFCIMLPHVEPGGCALVEG